MPSNNPTGFVILRLVAFPQMGALDRQGLAILFTSSSQSRT
jgi:hypothetical protein